MCTCLDWKLLHLDIGTSGNITLVPRTEPLITDQSLPFQHAIAYISRERWARRVGCLTVIATVATVASVELSVTHISLQPSVTRNRRREVCGQPLHTAPILVDLAASPRNAAIRNRMDRRNNRRYALKA
ncbi:hypothetical protein XAUB_22920 [Xanthomonas citri pv. aurantifolii str. ICPB 11122]|nr:hypothetical protein XAUB_22920 [Xanthomonas citri pv. aurantifolii str. ICPB 11122]